MCVKRKKKKKSKRQFYHWIKNNHKVHSRSEFHLCLVTNEVDFRLARLRWRLSGKDHFWRFLRLLHKNVDQCLLLVLGRQWGQSRCRWRWWSRRLYEHDLVMFLGWCRGWYVFRRFVLRSFWRRHVHVNVFVDDGLLLGRPIPIWGGAVITGWQTASIRWGEVGGGRFRCWFRIHPRCTSYEQ